MEAGLLSTKGEERMMSKEPLLAQEDYPIRPRTSRMSAARRALIVFGVCCLLSFTFVAVGVTKHVCPGHLRHGMGHGSMAPSASAIVEALQPDEKQFISSVIELARRQETNNSQSTPPPQTSTPPVSTSNPPADTSTTPLPGTTTTNTPPPATTTSVAPTVPTTTPRTSNTPPQDSSTPSPDTSTVKPPTTSTPAPTTRSTPPPEQSTTTPRTSAPGTTTQQPSSPTTGTSTPGVTTRSTGSTPPSSPSSAPETSISSRTSDRQTTAEETTRQTRATITTGSKTTSQPVPQTFTSTLPGGGITTITSTSWVAVVPAETAGSGNGSPDLQNAAPKSGPALAIPAVMAVVGGLLLL